jgi:hypothetical protein
MSTQPDPPPGSPKAGDDRHKTLPGWIRLLIGAFVAGMLAAWMLQAMAEPPLPPPPTQEIPYSEFKTRLAAGEIIDVTLDTKIEGVLKTTAAGNKPPRFMTIAPASRDPDLLKELGAAHVTYRARQPSNFFLDVFVSWIVPLALPAMLWSITSSGIGSRMGRGVLGVGRSKAVEVSGHNIGVTFKDVGGADEAIGELLRDDPELVAALGSPRLERAIGVIYVPETERRSHYFHARLPEQFDFIIHVDQTRAVEPLERTALWETEELAETFPSGL